MLLTNARRGGSPSSADMRAPEKWYRRGAFLYPLEQFLEPVRIEETPRDHRFRVVEVAPVPSLELCEHLSVRIVVVEVDIPRAPHPVSLAIRSVTPPPPPSPDTQTAPPLPTV